MTAASAQHCCGCSCPLLRHGGSGGADTSSTQGRGGGRAGWGKLNEGPLSGPLFFFALAVFIPLPKLAVCHTQYSSCEKMRKVCFTENRTHCLMYEVYDLPTGPKRLDTSKLSGNGLKMVRNETHVPRYPGYFEYSEYPPSEGQSHPGRPGPLRAWVGAPRPGPIQVPDSRFPIQVPDSSSRFPILPAGNTSRSPAADRLLGP